MHTLGRAAFVIGAALLLAVFAMPFCAPSFAAESGGTSQLKYVSMGSSYAAGVGVGKYDETSGMCDRSLSNYAQLLAHRRGLKPPVDVSCSGAKTDNILNTSQDGFPPQIDAVDADTRLVTVTIGGNDVNYIGNLLAYSCLDTHEKKCNILPDGNFQGLSKSLSKVVEGVKKRAPNARLVIIDYLPVLPSGAAGCPDKDKDKDKVPLTQEHLHLMQKVYSSLTQDIDNLAQEPNVTVLHASMIGSGHDACSTKPFVTDYNVKIQPSWHYRYAYHPNQDGMDKIASALNEMLGADVGRVIN